jgi:four helix bundle protein
MSINSYRDLEVWQKSMDLAVEVYRLAKLMPRAEEYRITSQVLRAVASVPANIAEGRSRGSRKEYAQHVSIARGSLAEAETFLMLAARTGLLAERDVAAALTLANEVGRQLNVLRQRLATPHNASPRTQNPEPKT